MKESDVTIKEWKAFVFDNYFTDQRVVSPFSFSVIFTFERLLHFLSFNYELLQFLIKPKLFFDISSPKTNTTYCFYTAVLSETWRLKYSPSEGALDTSPDSESQQSNGAVFKMQLISLSSYLCTKDLRLKTCCAASNNSVKVGIIIFTNGS